MVKRILEKEIKELKSVIKNIEKRGIKDISGHLRISKRNNYFEYYIKTENPKDMDTMANVMKRSVIITEKGERVRSKSEKIIADKLFMLGIPYRYEYPIFIDGNVKVYPDFTILKMPERKEVYLEHFGKMDDIEYVDTIIFKLNSYERNGIYLGVNLFVTYETSKKPINVKALDQMMKKIFIEQ